MKKQTRRTLLRMGWQSLSAAATLGVTRSFGQAGGSGRRVLVGIQLMGGNDSNNLVVPLEPRKYNAYAAGRGELALPVRSMLPIQSQRLQATFGLPSQTRELANLYQRQAMAIVANVGDTMRPLATAREAFDPAAVAFDASSHTAGSKMQFLRGGWVTPRWWSALLKASNEEFENEVFKFSGSMTAASRYGSWITGSHVNNPMLTAAMEAVAVQTPFPKTGIGEELLRAVKLAQAGANLGLGHQIVSCVLSGWDTHETELEKNARLYSELSQALNSFYEATVELGISRDVTAFTWSEFNRAFAPNETHGTGHGWGGHQMVIGDSVAGGEIYGAFPSFELGGPDDARGDGSWLPSTSTMQYASTLGSWFGQSAADQRAAWPTLKHFATANLGFMKVQ